MTDGKWRNVEINFMSKFPFDCITRENRENVFINNATTWNMTVEHGKEKFAWKVFSYITRLSNEFNLDQRSSQSLLLRNIKNSQNLLERQRRAHRSDWEWKQWQNNKFMRKFLESLSLKSCSAHRRYAFAMWMEMETIKMEMFAGWTARRVKKQRVNEVSARGEERRKNQKVALHNNFRFQR